MSETGRNEQIDADILQSRADILRAKNIVPPNKKKTGENITSPADTAKQPEPKQATSSQNEISEVQTKHQNTGQEKNEIPRFDLAEEIMAEQRKITAIRRKAPGKKIEAQKPEAKSIGYCLEQQRPTSPEQERIIAEIVARDIERLCRGDGVNDY